MSSWRRDSAQGWLPTASLLLVGGLGCAEEAEPSPPAELMSAWRSSEINPLPRPGRWERTQLSSTQPDLDLAVATYAHRARAWGLLPIVQIVTPWNAGGKVGQQLDDPAVASALEGLALIEIEYDDVCLEGGCGRWATDVLCGTFAQTFHTISRTGEPGGLRASPGKQGPETPAESVVMLRLLKALLADPPARDERSDARDCYDLSLAP